LLSAIETDDLAVNPIIYAELAPAYRTEGELERALRGWTLERLALPYEAGFLAGQAFIRYRERGGQRHSPQGQCRHGPATRFAPAPQCLFRLHAGLNGQN
jgi:hypothetical protein